MQRRFILTAAAAFGVMLAQIHVCSAPLQAAHDKAGQSRDPETHREPHVPQRIVSTAPSITEILYALGLGDRVAGVTRFCRYPPEAQSKPKIGDYINPNLEAIAALKPDLVIVQTNPVRLTERLAALHLHSIEIDQQNLDSVYRSIRAVADATGTQKRAAALIESMQADLKTIQDQASRFPKTRVLFIVGRAPSRLDGLIAVGGASYLNQLLTIAGGRNVLADAVASYPQISLEAVIARNPDVILDMGEMADASGVTEAKRKEVAAIWERAPTVSAVRNHQVYPVAGDIFVVPGPRAVHAARALFALLHPPAAHAGSRVPGDPFSLERKPR